MRQAGGVDGTGFTEDAANLVSRISDAEGTAKELLAYTWMKESIPPFNQYPVPNTKTNPKDPAHWDYGPFQLNAYWINRMILKGEISTDGINLGSALGGHGVQAGQPFVGDPFDNGRLAARKLNFHGTGENAAGAFTGGTSTFLVSTTTRRASPVLKKTDPSSASSSSNSADASFDAQTGSIRNIDFSNFTYNWYPKWEDMLTEASEFTLHDAKLEVDAPSNSNEPLLFELLKRSICRSNRR